MNNVSTQVKGSLVTNLGNVDCRRVNFSFLGGQFATEQTPIIFSNGMRINTHECLRNSISYKQNNKTTLFLTDLTNTKSIFSDSNKPQETYNLTQINSPITNQEFNSPVADDNYQIIKLQQASNSYYQMTTSTDTTINSDDVLIFTFQSDNTVTVQDNKYKYYLTSYYEGPSFASLYFQPRIYPELSSNNVFVDEQRFDYSLGPNTITLWQINDNLVLPRFTNAVVKLPTGVYACSSLSYLTSGITFPQQAALNFISYQQAPKSNSDIKNSFLARYDINPLVKQNTLLLDVGTKNQTYSQNYLGIFPHEYAIDGGDTATYPIAIHGLKNYQTPEYNYSFGFDYVQGQPGVRRIYENIYTGTNQDKGTDYVYLGFKSDTIKIEFPPDQETQFNFAPTSNAVPINNSGLKEDGAIAGELPFTSDRVYMSQQNYQEIIPDMSQPSTINRYSNTWLCSWLSGSMNGNKIWMDRYYNPAYYTVDQALSSKVIVYTDRKTPSEPYTFDVPSTVVFYPGAIYKYFHTGRQNRLNFVSHLLSNSILQVTNWNTSPLVDESKFKSEGILYFNSNQNLKGDYLNLDGSNHVLFPATTDLLSESKLTVSIFLNVADWNNIYGNQIFGNYYDSGFGLMNDSSLTTPIFTLIDNNTLSAYNFNYKFAQLDGVQMNYNSDYLNTNEVLNGKKIVQRLSDYSYWIFDASSRVGIKYDITNQVLVSIDPVNHGTSYVNLRDLKQIDQIEIDGNENLYIYDNLSKKYVILRNDGLFLGKYSVPDSNNRIEISLNTDPNNLINNVLLSNAKQTVVDNNNNIWEVVGGNLYADKQIFASLGNVVQLTVDANNYIWILSGQDTLTKIDAANKSIVYSQRIGKNSSLPENPCYDFSTQRRFINFLRIPLDSSQDPCGTAKIKTQDVLLLLSLDDNIMYMINPENGYLMSKLNLLGFTNNINADVKTFGDFTGYQYLRKYVANNKQISWKLKISDPSGTKTQSLVLPYNLSDLNPGWHQFSLSFDSQKGSVNYYLDSYLIGTQNFTPNNYIINYIYRTSLLLGCESVANTTLNDIIKIDNGYKFIGQVAELRLYNKSLTQGEIEQLFLSSKYAAKDKNLIWNMSIGERNYIEQIQHWYKMQLPGSKSKYYNINIHNLPVTNDIKLLIENGIKNNLFKIAPAQTTLYKINWK